MIVRSAVQEIALEHERYYGYPRVMAERHPSTFTYPR